MMTRHNADAIRRAIDGYRELGVDEIMFVPATADLAEVERLVRVLESA
jgi:hypothetical protein